MTYEEFVRLKKKPLGKASSKWTAFPLWFADHDEISEAVADFSVIDDFMMNCDMDDFSADFKTRFPNYQQFAACDPHVATDRNPAFCFDSYAEFFLVVDKSSNANRVLVWTGEGNFESLFDTFTEFWASLVDWPTVS